MRLPFRKPAFVSNLFLECFLGVIIAVFLGHSPVYANGTGTDEVVKAFEARREMIRTYRAHFIQKKTLAVFEEEKISTGVVIYQAPQTMIFKYETPDKTQMRVDSKAVSFYFPTLNQIEIHPFEEGSGASPFFFAFEATTPELKKNFDVSEYSTGDGKLYRMDLFPKTNTIARGLKSLTLWIGKSDYLPEKILVQEISGDTTEIQLSQIQVNIPISENELEFDAPKGTEVIHANPDGL